MRAARRFRPEGEAPFRVTAAFIQPVRGPLTPTLSPQAGRGRTLRQCLGTLLATRRTPVSVFVPMAGPAATRSRSAPSRRGNPTLLPGR